MTPQRKTLISLGRYGDIINVLPMAYGMAARGDRPVMCVAEEFESVLDGVGYVDKVVFPGAYDDPAAALRWLKANRPRDQLILAQAYRHPFDKRRLTDSYQTEAWRLAGRLEEFGCWPTVFDRRNADNERTLAEDVFWGVHGQIILVATESTSSPFRDGKELLQAVRAAFRDQLVIDLSAVRAKNIQDLLGLYDRAACLVTVDTVHLHLARAARVPVVSLISEGNAAGPDSWLGSVPPPNALCSLNYSFARKDAPAFTRLVEEVAEVLAAPQIHRFVVHVSDLHGNGPREQAAQATWVAGYGDEDVIDGTSIEVNESARAIGDQRDLPRLSDLLFYALGLTHDADDVIVWTPDDVSFEPGAFEQFRKHAGLFGAFSMRRTEPGQTAPHLGRELFGFTAGWLRANLSRIPAFYCGAPAFDIVLAAIIRDSRGIRTTRENLGLDFYPCELESGSVRHQPHPSSWAGPHEYTMPANAHNLRLARAWFAERGWESVV